MASSKSPAEALTPFFESEQQAARGVAVGAATVNSERRCGCCCDRENRAMNGVDEGSASLNSEPRAK